MLIEFMKYTNTYTITKNKQKIKFNQNTDCLNRNPITALNIIVTLNTHMKEDQARHEFT